MLPKFALSSFRMQHAGLPPRTRFLRLADVSGLRACMAWARRMIAWLLNLSALKRCDGCVLSILFELDVELKRDRRSWHHNFQQFTEQSSSPRKHSVVGAHARKQTITNIHNIYKQTNKEATTNKHINNNNKTHKHTHTTQHK